MKEKRLEMSTSARRPASNMNDLVEAIGSSAIVSRDQAAHALGVVRDGVITGEGPTTKGRVHFSRSLDIQDAEWCARILRAEAVDAHPVSRDEVSALFQIDEAAAERSDDGQFDDLFAKAVAHYAASASGLKVPARSIALSPDTAIESWAPARASGVNTEVLEWISSQMRRQRRTNKTLMALAATVFGITAAPLTQSLPGLLDLGM